MLTRLLIVVCTLMFTVFILCVIDAVLQSWGTLPKDPNVCGYITSQYATFLSSESGNLSDLF